MSLFKGLIGIDLDGTLLHGSQAAALPDDVAALRRAMEAGYAPILATGRSHFSSRPVAESLGFDLPHVCYNGGVILGPSGEIMRDLRVPLDIARPILARCREMGLAVRVFVPEGVIMSEEPGPDELFFKYRAWERVDTAVADNLMEPPMQMVIVHLDDVSAFASEFAGTQAESELRWVFQGHDPETPHFWALHVLNPRSMKSLALAQLCEQWDIDRGDTLAFGDGTNDVDMLEWAGEGVSFPWGAPEAMQAASTITAPNDPHPIATVVKRWMERPAITLLDA